MKISAAATAGEHISSSPILTICGPRALKMHYIVAETWSWVESNIHYIQSGLHLLLFALNWTLFTFRTF